MQGVVFQAWCGGKFDTSTVLHCGFNTRRQIAITRRAGKDLAPDVGRRHHVATAGLVWTGQGRRSSEASVEHGRSASLRTWLRYVCTTLSELQFERGSLFPCSLDQALFRLRWISFRDHFCLAPKKCLFATFAHVNFLFLIVLNI